MTEQEQSETYSWSGDPDSSVHEKPADKDAYIGILEAKVGRLEETERAVLNVLEDSRALEEQLRDRAEELKKFQLAVEKSSDVIVITDPDGIILYANPATAVTTGFSEEEIVGGKPSLWGRQMPKEFYGRLWETIRSGASFSTEVTNRKKDGSRYVAELNINPILGENGEIRFFVGVQHDVTVQRKARDELIAQADRLEIANENIAREKEKTEAILRFLRSIGDGVLATDLEKRIIFANKAASILLASDDIEGKLHKDVFRIVSEKDRAEVVCPVAEIISGKTKEPIHGQGILLRHDASSVPVSFSASPIYDGEGGLLGAMIVLKDRSDEREAARTKDRFLSVSAHQLRTPLSGMRWSMEMLLGGDLGKLPKEARDMVARIHANNVRMIELVGDLLDVARINEGTYREKALPLDVAPLVNEVMENMKSDADNRRVTLAFTSGGDAIPKVLAAPKRLYEVIENLLGNAIKYTDAGGTVAVTLCQSEGGVTLSVADTGIGIPAHEQEKIFSKFFRASNAMRKNTEGSGLGLSVVKSFMEEIGGRVWFESVEGKGTTFFVEVPGVPVAE
jgi:PAS domain S-box-containing protein